MCRYLKKPICLLLIILSIVAFLLPGCQRELPNELRIMYAYKKTAKEEWFSEVLNHFQELYPDVAITLEAVPEDEEALKRLQTEIMAGKGPDVYLLNMAGFNILFPDAEQAMYNGMFADIGEFYDADEALGKDALNKTVMDGGVIEDRRYLLPLLYDIPVAYVDIEQFEALGGSLDMFDGGIMELFNDVLASNVPELITSTSISFHCIARCGQSFFPQTLDYNDQKVLLNEKELSRFFKMLQTVRATEVYDKTQINFPRHIDELMQDPDGGFWTDYVSMYIGCLSDHLTEDIVYGIMSGRKIATIPVAAMDGDLVAAVKYVGAVSNSCKNPSLAYQFIRLFLTEQAQWSKHLKVMNGYNCIGWPVRTEGCVSALLETSLFKSKMVWLSAELDAEIPTISDNDVPILSAPVDRVTFSSITYEPFKNLMNSVNDQTTGEVLSVDIDAMVASLLEELEWHLYEG